MCGIVGYVGAKPVVPVVLDGLKRLEYRGYDSAGIAVAPAAVNGDAPKLEIRRASGKLRNLEEAIRLRPLTGSYGIGHTRWATHGRPTEENAHPHRDCHDEIVVVHNGIIENYLTLKRWLAAEGHQFRTETDTEVIAHLIESYSRPGQPLEEAVRQAVGELTGVYALAIISVKDPEKIVAVRNGPPAVIGLGEDEYFVASDVPAILHHTRDVFFLADGDLAVITRGGVRLMDFAGRPVNRAVTRVTWDPILAEKGGFQHFMLKEIYEQPRAVRDTLLGRLSLDRGEAFLDEMEIGEEEIRRFSSLRIVACGTSWHAALAGKFMIERLARVPVEVDYGSEFRYRDPLVGPEQLVVLISQSGETADTIAALRQAREQGAKTLAICNVVGGMLAREAHGTLYTHAGPEIGVASTKAFTAQLAALLVLALYLGRTRGALAAGAATELMEQLERLPGKLEAILHPAAGRGGASEEDYSALARRFHRCRDFLYLGRGIHYPIALEGALKLKEISYIHAEGYPAGEMKHGPNALIDENLPVVVLATRDPDDVGSVTRYEKTLSNLREVKARDGQVIAIVNQGDTEARAAADHAIEIPAAPELLLPILEAVPLQLLAYHIGVRRGCDVDQPRNLAKSVTVE
jgi:glucosamine--fructose-6-phosphate aminotransferase (isomerizing)